MFGRTSWLVSLAAVVLTTGMPAPAYATRPGDVPALGRAPASAPIPSTSKGALLEPKDWSCEVIRPEYNDWLRSGHKARDWKHVGKLYRAESTGEYYTWNDWQAWSRQAHCGAGGLLAVERENLGTVIWVTGMILLFVSFGSGPDSPG